MDKTKNLFTQPGLDPVLGKIYSVSEITAEIKGVLLENFGFEPFWIKGEISNFKGRNSQGHIYFRLKDEKAVINAAFFSYANRRLMFALEEGMQVFALGKISLYEPHGSYQLIVEELRPVGLGELYLRFEQLKKKLEAEGLFYPERKKELPKIPDRVGIITSPTGAAIKDMLKIIRNRLPLTEVVIFPVRVQGDEAKNDIVRAIHIANKKVFELDVIILGRGGGSIEELWAFNEENVARAIAKSKIPIISAVGHETDFTISDFVSDLRAATPSNAAELVVPHRKDLKERIDQYILDIISSIKERLNIYDERLKGLLRTPVLRDPMTILRARQQLLDNLVEGAHASLRLRFERFVSRFKATREAFIARLRLRFKSKEGLINAILAKLEALNPLGVLERGYAIAKDSQGRIIKSYKSVEIDQQVDITLHEGGLGLTVKSKRGTRHEKEDSPKNKQA